MSDLIAEIKSKCEQYWNEANICDEEIHAILEFIHVRCSSLDAEHARQIADLKQQLEAASGLQLIIEELARARAKFPWWPKDPIHAAAIVAEEAGELVKDALQMVYEPDKPHNIAKEAIQTAAMALRFLLSINDYKTIKSEQLFDYAGQRIHELEAQLQDDQPCP